ncbi:hypothetical protein [Clostridium cellulovorans]|uniref:Uncharacterized protein n=1 Tax=Clostridium cellulovorans (strain ATCC 35296 / DSM 3052 / OCM 3 / 743B) TaxID=573061 RepID=D9SSC5_CLOC7|nr:hypothetical protein [Clostridium cellulovorans]ADL50522.1 hypothetical protein Clocel_0752 [Clostridium cellulovorans 743B]
MSQNIIECLREAAINKLFSTKGFSTAWPTWNTQIKNLAPAPTQHQILSLGDHLKDIFYSTNTSSDRSQSDVSGGGANWEALVCWYLNLCLIGRRTVVIKHSKGLIPEPVSNAITVNYGSFISNTESDLVAITFPDKAHYKIDKDNIEITDTNGDTVLPYTGRSKKYNLLPMLNALVAEDFKEIEVHVIQCKTNWNDNAQIPMLWDMIYSAKAFRTGISIGREGYSIADIAKFSYSFVTVPTVKLEKLAPTSVAVQRVRNISGGNYWGLATKSGVASSIKEILERNLKSGHSSNHLSTIKIGIPLLSTDYSYFRI